jgi:hypothetical protein
MANDFETGRDVYAGDNALHGSADTPTRSIYEYEIEGDAEPNVLALVSNLASLANVAPRSCRMSRMEGHRAIIWIALDGISDAKACSIRRKLEQLTCVTTVKLSQL